MTPGDLAGTPENTCDEHGSSPDVHARIDRACAAALSPTAYPPLPEGHPASFRVARPQLGLVRLDLIQVGVRIEAPDQFTLGVVVARLVAALEAEGFASLPGDPAVVAPGVWHAPTAAAIGLVVFV